MTTRGPKARVAGWSFAALFSLGLLGFAAAMALAGERQPPALFFELAALPPSAPAVAAIAEPAPSVAAEPPPPPDEPAGPEAAPDLPTAVNAPDLAAAAPLSLPAVETPVTADVSLPPTPETAPEPPKDTPVAAVQPETKPKPKPKPKAQPTAKAEKKQPAEKAEQSADAAASAGAMAAGGGLSPAAYARAVLKKVSSTKRLSGAGKGSAVVGFTIADNGGLAGVRLLQRSGNAALDDLALAHIQRSAPFPPPPEGAGRSYSFEFVGK